MVSEVEAAPAPALPLIENNIKPVQNNGKVH